MTSPTIRLIKPADIPDVVAMIHELSAFHDETGTVSIATVTRDTTGPHPWWHVYVAEHDTALIGYMVLLPCSVVGDGARGIDIDHLYVRAPYRGTSIGRAFIAVAETHAKTQACGYLTIGTAPGNTAAQTAYTACGFTRLPHTCAPRYRLNI